MQLYGIYKEILKAVQVSHDLMEKKYIASISPV
jgi:hypothetical protein